MSVLNLNLFFNNSDLKKYIIDYIILIAMYDSMFRVNRGAHSLAIVLRNIALPTTGQQYLQNNII